MTWVLENVAAAAIPLVLLPVGWFLFRSPSAIESFKNGAEQGLKTAIGLLPTLLLLLVGVYMFRASGAVSLISAWLSPLTEKMGVPSPRKWAFPLRCCRFLSRVLFREALPPLPIPLCLPSLALTALSRSAPRLLWAHRIRWFILSAYIFLLSR